ncbi:hypothetical protein KSS87_016342 [Heliosperma pusillum]|nr:hypothetical protein KSS87_016342 [Heliosperma pusillum]
MSAFESRLILLSISVALRIPLCSYEFGIGFSGGAELNGLYKESEDEEHLQKEIYRDGGGGIDGWEWRKEGNGETEWAREWREAWTVGRRSRIFPKVLLGLLLKFFVWVGMFAWECEM